VKSGRFHPDKRAGMRAYLSGGQEWRVGKYAVGKKIEEREAPRQKRYHPW